MSRHPGTVVVGAGIAGAAVALALRERRAPVTIVDRARPGRATSASAGMLTPLYEAAGPDPLVSLGVRGLAGWPVFAERLELLGGAPVPLRQDGLLVANFDAEEETAAATAVRRFDEAGREAELLDPARAARIEPAIGEAASWLWLPAQGQVDAQALASRLPDALEASGARLLAGAEVVALVARGGVAVGVELAGGERLDAERVVLAAGAWSADLRGLPRPLPVRPVRGQMLRVVGAPEGLRRLVADHDGRYVVPREGARALAGSTMEEAGFEIATTAQGLERVREGARRLVPGLARAPETEAWAGLRPITPDGRPVLGTDPDLEGLFYATGYGRNGILIAPVAGEAIAGLVLGEEVDLDLGAFGIARFG